jgi:predicted GNAT family acetyltransferase
LQHEISYSSDRARVDWNALKRDLTTDHFDNGRAPEELCRSFENSFAVVFARDGDRIIGKARALSDGVCNAYIVDVWTHSDYRRRGIATTMMKMLLSKLDGQHVYLVTDDQTEFYETLGFKKQPEGMSRIVGTWLRPAHAD